ncbi:hypothetical protein JTE90_004936 [Oedothorax gibbosus]|uniref:Uncharacterized protein n=1 Tax=Oedothorax gibbosus TaxID=931172 RepID=A0AAV6TJE1_9ARAC|nr:hypothetical protein JTE90_004936 [Oedothorax gibbosus]
MTAATWGSPFQKNLGKGIRVSSRITTHPGAQFLERVFSAFLNFGIQRISNSLPPTPTADREFSPGQEGSAEKPTIRRWSMPPDCSGIPCGLKKI